MEISTKYFLDHLVERLKHVDKLLCSVDDVLYDADGFDAEHDKVRECTLIIEDLISAITEE